MGSQCPHHGQVQLVLIGEKKEAGDGTEATDMSVIGNQVVVCHVSSFDCSFVCCY